MSEVVRAYKRRKNVWGIEGYNLPTFDAHFDKPMDIKIIKTKRTSYIDEYMKVKKFVPEPTIYNTIGNILNEKRHSSMPKSERIT